MTSEQTEAYIAGLIREREHYVQYDEPNRIAQVDAELAKLGKGAKPPVRRAEKMTAPKATEV